MHTVLIADDHADARRALRAIVGSDPALTVVGEAADGEQAVALARRRRPDLVLMDVRMPRRDGLSATRELTATAGGPAVLVLTTFDEDAAVFGALQAGAHGFLLKTASAAQILEALHALAAGHGLVAPEVTRRLIERYGAFAPARPDDPGLARLSPRERDVLERIAAGMTNGEIAADLVLEESTVKSHVSRLLATLELPSRVHAVIWAYETGFVRRGTRDAPFKRDPPVGHCEQRER